MNPGISVDRPTVLTCWKDIAKYMGKGVRTVQRWEQEFGLPVRRPLGTNKKAVLARPRDLDAWVALRCGARCPTAVPEPGDGYHRRSVPMLSALASQIETARQLRDNNRALLSEFGVALSNLQKQISSLHNQP